MKSEFNKKSKLEILSVGVKYAWHAASSLVRLGILGGGLWVGYGHFTAPDTIDEVIEYHSINFSQYAQYQSRPYIEAEKTSVTIRAAHFEGHDGENFHGEIAAASLDFQNQMKCGGGCYSTVQLDQDLSLLSPFEKNILIFNDQRILVYNNFDIVSYSKGRDVSASISESALDIFFQSYNKVNEESQAWLHDAKSLIFNSAGNDGDLPDVKSYTVYLNDIDYELKSDSYFGVGAVWKSDSNNDYFLEDYSSPSVPTFLSETPFELNSDGGLQIESNDEVSTYKVGTSFSAPNAGGKSAYVMAQVEKENPDTLTEYDYVFAAMLSANRNVFDAMPDRYSDNKGQMVKFQDNGSCALSYNFNFAGFGVIESDPMLNTAREMAQMVKNNPSLKTEKLVHTQEISADQLHLIEEISYVDDVPLKTYKFTMAPDTPMVTMTKQLYVEFDGDAPTEVALQNSQGVEIQVPVVHHEGKIFITTHGFAGNDVGGEWSLLYYGHSDPMTIKTVDYGVKKNGVVTEMLLKQARSNSSLGKCPIPDILSP